MSSRLKPPTRREMLFMVAAACLVVTPQFILKAAIFNFIALFEWVALILLVSCLMTPLWFFYRIFLKGPLRARRIQRIREQRLMREIMEENESNGN